jgi:RNA polymerase primary sigma factor
MNYLKFRADRLRRRLNPKTATLRQLADIERLQREALATRNGLVEANLRLVFSLAKRYATVGTAAFDDFISDGHMTLMRAIEKFDFARGVKFSTYATWSVINGFNALLKKESSVQRRHVSDQMEGVAESLTDHRVSKTMERSLEELQQSVGALLENLNARERRIIEARFGFGIDPPPTLKKVGERIGVSKERVRQLQERAVQKLRELAEEQHLELPYE